MSSVRVSVILDLSTAIFIIHFELKMFSFARGSLVVYKLNCLIMTDDSMFCKTSLLWLHYQNVWYFTVIEMISRKWFLLLFAIVLI